MSRRSPKPRSRSSPLDVAGEAAAGVIVVVIVGAAEVPHVVAVAEDSAGTKSVTSSRVTTMTTTCTVRLPTNLFATSRRRRI